MKIPVTRIFMESSSQKFQPLFPLNPWQWRRSRLFSSTTVLFKSKLPVTSPAQQESCPAQCDSRHVLWELHSGRIIEVAIFGINYWWRVQQETNSKFCLVLTRRLRKMGIIFGIKFFQTNVIKTCKYNTNR